MQYYAFLERIDLNASDDREKNRVRTNYIFDAISQEGFESKNSKLLAEETPLIRVMTTGAVFERLSGHPPQKGDWYSITLEAQGRNKPRTWQAFPNSHGSFSRAISGETNLAETTILPLAEEAPFGTRMEIREQLESTYRISGKGFGPSLNEPPFLKSLGKAKITRVEAIDVGQASMIAFFEEDLIVAFYDVGWPLPFNISSAPKNTQPLSRYRIAPDCIVILSHWDFDHYSYAQIDNRLRNCIWIAPGDIGCGPNAKRFIEALKQKLYIPSRDQPLVLDLNWLRLEWANGSTKNKNDSGLVAKVSARGGIILLTGDASYDQISPRMKQGLTGVAIPHHASPSSGNYIPNPTKNATCKAVACAGMPNMYRHPSGIILDNHKRGRWSVDVTGKAGQFQRGSKTLLP